jgi:hypothetical protein
MTRIVRIVAVLLLALWTLLAWGAQALLGAGGELLAMGTPWLAAYPEAMYWLRGSFGLIERFGSVFLWILWGLGTLAIVLSAWLGPHLWRALAAALTPALRGT